MRRLFMMSAFVAVVAAAVTACGPDVEEIVPPVLEGSGITSWSWTDEVKADEEGDMLSLTFTSEGKWTAVSSEPSWCSILTSEGVAGEAALRISVATNVKAEPRSAVVTISVEGYPSSETFTVSQAEGVTEKGNGIYREVNEWTYKRMSETYLWNETIPELALDYSVDYQAFLTSILDGVGKNGDVNHDDGAYKGDMRTEYYTTIVSNAPVTKTVGAESYANGFFRLRPVDIGAAIGVIVDVVVPGGPADKAGLKRGHFITEVNGIPITRDNYQSVTTKIYTDPVTVLYNTVEWQGANRDKAVLAEVGEVALSPDYYIDPAIYKAETVELSNGKKVGYLLYMGFHTDYDKALMDVFDKFKADGIDDLVLDLRYNNGGEIISSTVMATMIAGARHEGEILAKLSFNAARTAEGVKGEYRIGVQETIEYPDGYPLIQDALQHSLDLERVFVIATGYTASASEIIINGLRGLDIEVNHIGTTTSGKNVGMEGFSRRYQNYDFLLYPVSFYIENAKGFKDYPDGFSPDLYLDDSSYYPGGDFGSPDDFLCNAAYGWIRTGQNPAKSSAAVQMKALDSGIQVMNSRMGGNLVIYGN